ncbi:MAG: glutamate--cysteine ligase [Bdellovibrionaceae bacterium]|nr:glutamate--cysteine ligase [Pseudobdellovibrionaceae bacterium]
MAQKQVHQGILKNMDAVCAWYKKVSAEVAVPVYSSYDIRDAGYKIANVDANIYPAGFNNICPADRETSVGLMGKYIKGHYGAGVKRILLVTEEHTQNPFYWENVGAIKDLIEGAGYELKIGFPRLLPEPMSLTSATGRGFQVESAMPESAMFRDFRPDLVISNNDFSNSHEEWGRSLPVPVNPPRELGWYQRKKSRYFRHYNDLVNEFSKVAELDPFLLRVETEEFQGFEIESEESRRALAARVDTFLEALRDGYRKRGLTQEPFVFVKNNAGTYGLAVVRVSSGRDVLEWNYKSRKKMKAAKGGRDVEEVIIQEGIPSVVKSDNASAEPVIYMIGCELAGGFLRTHAEKDDTESLNSPGAVYRRLCVSDLLVDPQGCPKENVYGWSAKLGLLAIGREAHEMGVVFKDYKQLEEGCGSKVGAG